MKIVILTIDFKQNYLPVRTSNNVWKHKKPGREYKFVRHLGVDEIEREEIE